MASKKPSMGAAFNWAVSHNVYRICVCPSQKSRPKRNVDTKRHKARKKTSIRPLMSTH